MVGRFRNGVCLEMGGYKVGLYKWSLDTTRHGVLVDGGAANLQQGLD